MQCIPAIYRCILAYLPIFFNQLSKFFRCESPSTFLGTCLSHHSFIIFLVTNTNTLLSGLYLISTTVDLELANFIVIMCQCPFGLIPHFYSTVDHNGQLELIVGVNALSGLYLISTEIMVVRMPTTVEMCQCPLGLIPHFYGTPSKT